MTDVTPSDRESESVTNGPQGSRVHIPIHLRWGDLDALGHVNNASMFRLLEEARLRAFWRPEGGFDAPSTAIIGTELVSGTDTMAVIARQEIEYLTPVPYGRLPLDVQLWIGRLGGSSVEICYEVLSPSVETNWVDGGISETAVQITYGRASGVMVMLDAATMRPRRLTETERAAWEPIVGEPIQFGKRR